jgi:hypothetical protein
MDDNEREKIADRARREAREEAELENRVRNVEAELKEMRAGIVWGIRAIWGGVAYLLVQLWTFISQGGSFK